MSLTMKSRLTLFPLVFALLNTSFIALASPEHSLSSNQSKGTPTMETKPKLIEKTRLRELDFEVTSMAWSPDGKQLAMTGTHTKKVHVWDVQNERVVRELSVIVPASAFGILTYSPDGRYLAACQGGYQAPVRIWNTQTWEIVKDLTGEIPGGCVSISFSPDRKTLAVGMYRYDDKDKNFGVALYDTSNWKKTKEFIVPKVSLTKIAFIPDGAQLAVGGHRLLIGEPFGQAVIELWDVTAAKSIKESVVHPKITRMNSMIFNPKGKEIVIGFNTGVGHQTRPMQIGTGEWVAENNEEAIRAWSISKDSVETILKIQLPGEGSIYGMAFSPDGKWLLAGTGQHRLRLFNGESHELLDTADTLGYIAEVTPSPDANLFATSSGKLVSIWAIKPR